MPRRTMSALFTAGVLALAMLAVGDANATSQVQNAAPPAPVEPFSGRWQSSFGELRIHQIRQNGFDYIIGDYADRGILVGRIIDAGRCAAGVFTNGERNGSFQFVLKGNRRDRFGGLWAWHDSPPDGEWTGRRTGPAPDRLSNFSRNGALTRTLPQDRAILDGLYQSRFGMLELTSRDLFLLGAYADKGVIAGMWDGNGFVGHFTNGSRTGWFNFDVLSKTGAVRGGQWGWAGQGAKGEWSPKAHDGARTLILEPLEVDGHLGC
ncbi:hypothetical protein [Roseovarius salis]|uniref:hypothetical protein n=1 Tax=Roseovarius salis TaxID=3376063 RepID=UPI0037C9A6E9